ncbi:MAG: flagellar export protein FliJ [Lysobacterales bacterium]
MTRATRIERIMALKRLDELLAARQLMTARQQLDHGQQIHGDLVNYCDHYNVRSQQLSTRVDAASIQRERQFSEQLGKAVYQQEAVLKQQRERVHENNQQWLSKRTRSLATEALLRKVKEAETRRAEQLSAKETDELAQRTALVKLR